MNRHTIQKSLSLIDPKFTEEMSAQQRRMAVRQFRKLYSDEMGKLTTQLLHQQKIQHNLDEVNKEQQQHVKKIDSTLQKRIKRTLENRHKEKEAKKKKYQEMEEGWKMKLEEAARKKKAVERESVRKAMEMRKEAEKYWQKKEEEEHNRKKQHQNVTPTHSQVRHAANASPIETMTARHSSKNYKYQLTAHASRPKVTLPDLTPQQRTVSMSYDQSNMRQALQNPRQRRDKQDEQREQNTFQKIMGKLDRIQMSRKTVHDRVQKQIQDAKKNLPIWQDPQQIKRNRQRSLQQNHSKRTIQRSKASLQTKNDLDGSMVDRQVARHLDAKRRIQQQQFEERQALHEARLRRQKKKKIGRLVKEAVGVIKQQTLRGD